MTDIEGDSKWVLVRRVDAVEAMVSDDVVEAFLGSTEGIL
jgi:hypothetical protein